VIATPVAALSAAPARVAIAPRQTLELHVTNTGRTAAVVVTDRAGLARASNGRPEVLTGRRPAWLRVSPRRFPLGPGHTVSLRVTAGTAEPGDHPALLLLRTEPLVRGSVAVRMQIGVIVTLHAPGRIVHDLHVLRVRLHARRLRLVVANRGNVTERLAPTVLLLRRDRIVARIRPRPRELLPRGKALVEVRLPPHLRGPFMISVLGRTLRVRS